MDIKPKKLVCVFAHPDDEAFGPAGTIAKFASEGAEVYLICVTNGASFGDTKLVEIRKKELLASAKILGVRKTFFLNFADGELNNNNYHDVTKEIKKVIDKIRPDTLMTFDMNGLSGHLDHIAVSMQSSFIFERTAYIRRLLYFREKKLAKKYLGKNYFVYFPDGYDKEDADIIVDTSKYAAIKKKAIMVHKSQLNDDFMKLLDKPEYFSDEYFKVVTK